MKYFCWAGWHSWRITSMGRHRKTLEGLGLRTVCDYTRQCWHCGIAETVISGDIPRKVRT